MQRKIILRGARGEVADECNRYGHIPLMDDDAALRKLPLTGVFDAFDTASFAASSILLMKSA